MSVISEHIQGTTAIANIANPTDPELYSIEYPEINHMIGNNFPMIDLPFPPIIEPKDLIINKKAPQDNPNGKQSRAPNAFIIYRKAFVKAARDQGYILPMTAISSLASASWEQESPFVKEEYKKIAKDTHKLIKEMFPKKPNQRKRKEKWNLVSFHDKSSDGNNKNKKEINMVISTQEPTTINDNDDNNTTFSTSISSSSVASPSPILSEFDGSISENNLIPQQFILNEINEADQIISDDYLVDELNNTYLPNSFQDYLNSYLPGEDIQDGNNFLLKINQSGSDFTLEELFDNTSSSMDNLKDCVINNSPTSLNMTLAEAMGIINSDGFHF